jgi:hypothetical protein
LKDHPPDESGIVAVLGKPRQAILTAAFSDTFI